MLERARRSSAVRRSALAASVLLTVLLTVPVASAAGSPTKEECLDAHSKGQDAREAGQLSLARRLFLTCAQSSCPQLVQGDCARFSDELDRVQPTVSFAARDGGGADLPDTTVYVDGVLVATRLEDGKVHDLDPGHHAVRFLNGGREVNLTVVVNQGEKGRSILATFPAASGSAGAPAPGATPAVSYSQPAAPEPKRPVLPLVLGLTGSAVMATGVVLTIVGLGKVPSNCTLSPRECAAPPGDPSFDQAKSAVTLADVGLGLGIAGFATAAASFIWYFTSEKRMEPAPTSSAVVLPWAAPGGGGIALSGRM
jgi:hypothetical protein